MNVPSFAILPSLVLAVIVTLLGWLDRGHSPVNRVVAGEISFKDLDEALLPAEEGGAVHYPDWLADLDGQRVTVAGFMAPFDQLDDLSLFMLMPSYVGCYFCAPPSFTQVLLVRQKEDRRKKKKAFIDPPIRVTGVLRLYHPGSDHPAHRDQFVYALDDAVYEVVTGDSSPQRAKGHGNNSAILARSNDGSPTQDPNQPHEAFQPQLLVPAVSALRGLPLRGELRFLKAESTEITRRLRLQIENGLSSPQREIIGRMLAALGLGHVEAEWMDCVINYELERRAGVVSSNGNRIIYHEALPLSKPAGRLAMAGLIYEALLRQNHPVFFDGTTSADAWLARRALLEGDLKVLKSEYVRRNWLSAPDPLPSLFEIDPGALLTPPMLAWLELTEQTGERFVRSSRQHAAHGFLDGLYKNPQDEWVTFLRPPIESQPLQALSASVLEERGVVLKESRLGAATLGAWHGRGLERSEPEGLVKHLLGDRAAFVRLEEDGQEYLMWETWWQDERSAMSFFKSAKKTVESQVLPQGARRMQVHLVPNETERVMLQVAIENPSVLTFE